MKASQCGLADKRVRWGWIEVTLWPKIFEKAGENMNWSYTGAVE